MKIRGFTIVKNGIIVKDHPEPLMPDENISFTANAGNVVTVKMHFSDQLQDNQADALVNSAQSGQATCANCASCNRKDTCSKNSELA